MAARTKGGTRGKKETPRRREAFQAFCEGLTHEAYAQGYRAGIASAYDSIRSCPLSPSQAGQVRALQLTGAHVYAGDVLQREGRANKQGRGGRRGRFAYSTLAPRRRDRLARIGRAHFER